MVSSWVHNQVAGSELLLRHALPPHRRFAGSGQSVLGRSCLFRIVGFQVQDQGRQYLRPSGRMDRQTPPPPSPLLFDSRWSSNPSLSGADPTSCWRSQSLEARYILWENAWELSGGDDARREQYVSGAHSRSWLHKSKSNVAFTPTLRERTYGQCGWLRVQEVQEVEGSPPKPNPAITRKCAEANQPH